MTNELNPKAKSQVVSIGIILILVLAVVSLLVLANFYLTDKLVALQSATQSNYTRISQIETFLNQQLQAAQKQPSEPAKPAAVEPKAK